MKISREKKFFTLQSVGVIEKDHFNLKGKVHTLQKVGVRGGGIEKRTETYFRRRKRRERERKRGGGGYQE